jgi:hypothetical protein
MLPRLHDGESISSNKLIYYDDTAGRLSLIAATLSSSVSKILPRVTSSELSAFRATLWRFTKEWFG